MKIKFKLTTGYLYDSIDAERRGEPLPRTATLEVAVKYTGFYAEHATAAFAKKTFVGKTEDEEIAAWAATTIANCLRGLVPESERCR